MDTVPDISTSESLSQDVPDKSKTDISSLLNPESNDSQELTDEIVKTQKELSDCEKEIEKNKEIKNISDQINDIKYNGLSKDKEAKAKGASTKK